MNVSNRVPAVAALLAVSLTGACASSSSGDAAGDGRDSHSLKIAYGSISDSNPQFRAVGEDLKRLTAAEGGSVTTFDNKFDAAAALSNTRLMIQQKPDVIIQWVPDAAARSVGKLIDAADIPCIAVNVAIPGCPLFNLSNDQIGADAGTVAAETAAAKGWTADDTTVALLFVAIAGEQLHGAVTHFYASYAKAFPDMKQVEPDDITLSTTEIGELNAVHVDSGATVDTAYAAMQRVLQIVPDGRHLVAQTQNDDIARGALRAIEQAGRKDDAIIASIGADAAAVSALRGDPAWVAEGDPSVGQWGSYLLAMSKALMDGATLPALTLVPQVTLSKDNCQGTLVSAQRRT